MVHAAPGELPAVRFPGVDLGLLQGLPSIDGHELMRGRAVLGRDRGAGLPQAVGGAMLEPGRSAGGYAPC